MTVAEPRYDVTYLFYEAEEIEAERNGLNLVSQAHPEWLAADFAVLLEPTYGAVEAGCQGTMRVERAHDRPAGPLGALLAGRQRDPRGRRGAAPAGRRTRRGR